MAKFFISLVKLFTSVAVMAQDIQGTAHLLVQKSLMTVNQREVKTSFKKSIDYYLAHDKFVEISENYFGMALVLALNGYYNESIRYHKKAIRAHRKHRPEIQPEIQINLGLTYQLAGKKRKAEKMLGTLYSMKEGVSDDGSSLESIPVEPR